MDKEKYLKLRRLIELNERGIDEKPELNYLFKYYEMYFTDEESLKAFKSIRDYLTKTYQRLSADLEDARDEFWPICKHEVVFKYTDINRFECALCQKHLDGVDFPSIIIEVEYKMPDTCIAERLVNDTIKKLLSEDKDILKNFENCFDTFKKENKDNTELVLRRIYDKK